MSSDATKASGKSRTNGAFTRNIPEDLMLLIKEKLLAGEGPKHIAQETGVSRQWIHDIKRKQALGGAYDARRFASRTWDKLDALLDALNWQELLTKQPEVVPKLMSELVKVANASTHVVLKEGATELSDDELERSIKRIATLSSGVREAPASPAGRLPGLDREATEDSGESGTDSGLPGGESIG